VTCALAMGHSSACRACSILIRRWDATLYMRTHLLCLMQGQQTVCDLFLGGPAPPPPLPALSSYGGAPLAPNSYGSAPAVAPQYGAGITPATYGGNAINTLPAYNYANIISLQTDAYIPPFHLQQLPTTR
jgi:hypothetical protein